jgi:hypothetical protein
MFRNYCPPLYFDDFSDSGSGWPIHDSGSSRREYLAGEYRILLRNTDWWAGAKSGFKASNYIVAVDVRNVTGVDGTYGLLFGLSDNWTQFYSVEIRTNGEYQILRYNSSSGWTTLAQGSSGSINTGTATNRLKVERNGSRIRAYANGQFLASVSDGSYTGLRHVGLIASSINQPNVDARFDNFTVYPVTCGAAATALGDASGTLDPDGGATETDQPDGWAEGANRKSK